MRFLIGIVVCALSTAVSPARAGAQNERFALVIGIKGYPAFPEGEKLRYADNDAVAFANFLKTPQGGMYPANQVKLLTNAGATLSAIQDSIEALQKTVESTPGAVLTVFYSGHVSLDARLVAYIMPWDANPQAPSKKGWKIDEFRAALSRIGAHHFILYLDGCHAETVMTGGKEPDVDDGKGGGEATTRTINAFNKALAAVPSSQDGVIYAAGVAQKSYEDSTLKHGIFTYYLLRGLHGAADSTGVGNRDGRISVAELLDFLRDSVQVRATQSAGHRQTPGKNPELNEGFPLAVYDTTRAESAARGIASLGRSAGPGPGRGLVLGGGDARGHFNEGSRLYQAGNVAGAAAEYRAALAIDPDYGWARNNLGVALDSLHDAAGATAEFRETVRRTPNYALAHRNLALHLETNGDTAQAMIHLRESVRLDPSNAHAQSDLGQLQTLRGETDSAEVHLLRAMRLDSTYAYAWYYYGGLRARTGDLDVALLFYNWSLRLAQRYPNDNPPARRSLFAHKLAALCDSAHDRQTAIWALRQALDADPGDASATRDIERLDGTLKVFRDTVALMRQRLDLNKEDTLALQSVVNLYHEQLLQPGDALAMTEWWLSSHPADTRSLSDRAENYFTAQRYDQASVALDRLRVDSRLSAGTRAALTAVSMANDVALHRTDRLSAKLAEIEQLVLSQPEKGYTIPWVFYGSRRAVRSRDEFQSHRNALLYLFEALSEPTRAAALAGIRRVKPML